MDRNITPRDREIDRENGRKAKGSTWHKDKEGVPEKTYYCKKCKHNHRLTSMIGRLHIPYSQPFHITARDRAIDAENGHKAKGSTWHK